MREWFALSETFPNVDYDAMRYSSLTADASHLSRAMLTNITFVSVPCSLSISQGSLRLGFFATIL